MLSNGTFSCKANLAKNKFDLFLHQNSKLQYRLYEDRLEIQLQTQVFYVIFLDDALSAKKYTTT